MIAFVLVFAALLGHLSLSYDRYAKPPWRMLILSMVLGVSGGWLIGFAEDIVLSNVAFDEFGRHAATAAIMEESVKLFSIAFLILCFRRTFQDPMDGLVCGSFFGLGFALLELRTYVGASMLEWQLPVQLLGAEMVRLMIHWLTGGMIGFAVGMVAFSPARRLPLWGLWPLAAMGIHFFWDFFCGLPTQGGEGWVLQRLVAVVLMLTAMGLYGWAVFLGMDQSKKIHVVHDTKPLWGWPFTMLVDTEGRRRSVVSGDSVWVATALNDASISGSFEG